MKDETFDFDFASIKKVGLTQAEFAILVGVSRPTANLWVNGKKMPSRRYRRCLNTLAPLITRLDEKGGIKHLRGASRHLLLEKMNALMAEKRPK